MVIDFNDIRAEIAQIMSLAPQQLVADEPLAAQGEWDSLAAVGTVAIVFDKTGVQLSTEDILAVATLQDVFDLIRSKAGLPA